MKPNWRSKEDTMRKVARLFGQWLFISILLLPSALMAKETSNVLLLSSYEPLYPYAKILIDQVSQALEREQRTGLVQLHAEYLDADLTPLKANLEARAQLLQQQHQRRPYDVIVAIGEPALEFAVAQQERFPDTPIVFLDVPDAKVVKELSAHVHLAGVMNTPPIYEFLTFLRSLYPEKGTFYFITDSLPHREKRIRRSKRAAESLNISVVELSLAELSWQELAQQLEQLGNEPIVFLSAYLDKHGEQRHFKQALAYLAKHSASPIWSFHAATLGMGITGAIVNDSQVSAKLVAGQIVQLLSGVSPNQLAIHRHPPVQTIIDAQQASAYGLSFKQFPKSAIYINQPDSWWQYHGRYGALILFLTALIVASWVLLLAQIKKKRKAEKELPQWLSTVQQMLDAVPERIHFKDISGRYIFCNEAFSKTFKENPIGAFDYQLVEQNIADLFRRSDQLAISSGRTQVNSTWMLDENQQSRLYEVFKTPIYNDAKVLQGVLGFSRDITELTQAQKELEHITQHDALTGLPNRALLLQLLKSAIFEAQQSYESLAVIYLDIDRFKDINDTLGHNIGDLLLKDVGHRLHNNIQQFDICARIESDEFVLVLVNAGTAQQVQEKCERLLEVLARPYSLQGHLISLYASAGIALYGEDGEDADALIRHADAALYMAKTLGRNRCHRYTADLTEGQHLRIELEQDLHSAMEEREFFLVYQPQFIVGQALPTRAEVLVRWQHPKRGLISPVEFISLAESSGMMVELGYWILRSACQQFLFWREQGLQLEKIAVNVSPVQITHSFANDVAHILADLEFLPEWLELEVTESLMMSDTQTVNEQVCQLRNLGVEFAIDDFGTGYSSLSKLKTMPVSILKIDQSFVRNIDTDHNDLKIVQAIIQMAKSLKLITVAEGVETQQHEDILYGLGCDLMQGYHYAKPMPADQLYETYRPLINDKNL